MKPPTIVDAHRTVGPTGADSVLPQPATGQRPPVLQGRLPIASESPETADLLSPTAYSAEVPDWKSEMAAALRTPAGVAEYVGLSLQELPLATQGLREFPVFAPRPYLNRVRRHCPTDPLLLQIWPGAEEDSEVPGFSADPLDEESATVVPGLLKKYQGRALMVMTGACAIHCRYCFRRHFDYAQTPPNWRIWEPALDAIRADTSIHEVLLSGGDPLSVVDETLSELWGELEKITHLRRVRIHTRLPVVIPQRITSSLISLLRSSRLTPYLVVHINHRQEIDSHLTERLSLVSQAGIPMLNQAVLLRHVNDDVSTLTELCEALVDLKILPYYLHQVDRVRGAAHFEVPVQRGLALMEELQARLPGYAIPRYVREIPNALSKVWVTHV